MVKYLFWNHEHTAAAPAVELRFQEGGPMVVKGNIHLGLKVFTHPLVVSQTRTETTQSSSLLDKFFRGVNTFKPKCNGVK